MFFNNLYQFFFEKEYDLEMRAIPASLIFWNWYFYLFFCTFFPPKFMVRREENRNPVKNSRKVRIIHAPNITMRIIHGAFIQNFLRKKELLEELPVGFEFVTGGIQGWNPLKNVEKHKNGRFFYLVDIHAFYDNIDGKRLLDLLCLISYEKREKLSSFLKKYCLLSVGRGLKTGAPASVDLANIFGAYFLDAPLAEICRKNGIIYTRYIDDLTFSSLFTIGKRVRKKIRQVILAAGLDISHRKSEVVDLLVKKELVITGIGLRFGGETFLPRNYLRKIQRKIHLAKKGFVPFNVIRGMMGAFFATTRKRHLPHFQYEIERELLKKFKGLTRLYKMGKIQ